MSGVSALAHGYGLVLPIDPPESRARNAVRIRKPFIGFWLGIRLVRPFSLSPLISMSYALSRNNAMPYFGGNRGIGFNRATWNTGNAIGRAARPFISRARSSLNSSASSLRTALFNRSSQQSSFRSQRTQRRRNLRAVQRSVQKPTGGGETKTSFVKSNPKLAMGVAKMLLGKNTVHRSGSGSSTAPQGLQNFTVPGNHLNVTDVDNAFTAIGGTFAGAASGKMAFLSLHSTLLLSNASSHNCHAIIYDVMARHDGSDINTGPSSLITTGGVDANNGTASDYTFPGSTPYDNPRFLEAYVILQKSPIIMSPGQTHAHRFTYNINKIISKERLINSDSAGPLGGLSVYSFVFFHGVPVHSAAAETTVTLGTAKLDWVSTESLTFQIMDRNYVNNSITSSLLTNVADPEQWTEDGPTDTANAI